MAAQRYKILSCVSVSYNWSSYTYIGEYLLVFVCVSDWLLIYRFFVCGCGICTDVRYRIFWVYVDRVWQWEGELLNTIGNPKGYILECECLTTTTLLSKYKIMCIHFDAHNLKTHSLSGLRSFLCGHQSTLPFQQASVHRGGGRFDFYPHYFVALVKSINTLTTRIEYILKRNFIK